MTNQPDDFKTFYPTSVMETGYDILPIWVLKMIMFGIYVTGKVPFENVLLHGLVRDREGQKISKSKGNVIDPIEMADKYGADALRMGLLWGALVENDVALSEENINAQRKFANKIWNAARYVLLQGDSETPIKTSLNSQGESYDVELTRDIKQYTKDMSEKLDAFKLSEAAEIIYRSFWRLFCDVYIEKHKNGEISDKSLKENFTILIKLLHPFMPFVTEQIWQEMGHKDLLIISEWPKV
jgi:valyl-tRNA synthetase